MFLTIIILIALIALVVDLFIVANYWYNKTQELKAKLKKYKTGAEQGSDAK